MKEYSYTIRNGIEQYAFKSDLNPDQQHFIDRVDSDEGGPWDISIADHSESLTPAEARTLLGELQILIAFAETLGTGKTPPDATPNLPLLEEVRRATK